jgi:CheY-like chemotaxis protein
MRPRDPYERPLRITAIADEVVFLGEGPIQFSMTREAATQTLENLVKALRSLPEPADSAEIAPAARALILVVEDEAVVRKAAAEMLEQAGYAVIAADGARQALLALEARGEIHLLFTDVQMPGDIDGIALARLVRRRWPRVRVLVTSGLQSAGPADLPDGGRFLSKPYGAADMLRQVDELMAA